MDKMTREEAIADIRDNIKPVVGGKSLDMAIEALEQEPCTDAISRQAAIDAIKKLHSIETEYDCTLYEKLDILYELEDLPPVTPEQTFEGMTNGEVMKAVFPKAKVGRYMDEYERPSDYLMYIDDETYFTKEWWNAPYKGGEQNESD